MAPSTSSALVTSATSGTTRRPVAFPISAASPSTYRDVRALMMTSAPASARTWAIPFPIPRPAPVPKTTPPPRAPPPPPQGWGWVAADQDGDVFPDGLREAADLVKGEELPLVRRLLLAPAHSHDLDRLVAPCPALGKRRAQ